LATKKPDEPMIGFLAAPLESKVRRTADGENPKGVKTKTKKGNLHVFPRDSDAKKVIRSGLDVIEERIRQSDGREAKQVVRGLLDLFGDSKPSESRKYTYKELTDKDALRKRDRDAYEILRSVDLAEDEVLEVGRALCEIHFGTPNPPWLDVKEKAASIYGQYLISTNVATAAESALSDDTIMETLVTAQCMKLEANILSAYVEDLWASQQWQAPADGEAEAQLRRVKEILAERYPGGTYMRFKGKDKRIEFPSHPHLEQLFNDWFQTNPDEKRLDDFVRLLTGRPTRANDFKLAAADVAEKADGSTQQDTDALSQQAKYLANEMGNEALGKRIRRWRKRCRLSVTEVAKLLDVSVQAVSNWENGYTPPSPASIKMLAMVFGISSQALEMGLQEEGEAPSTVRSVDQFNETYAEVGLYEVRFAAGGGSAAPEYHPDVQEETLVFRRSFFSSRGIDAKTAKCFRVHGDSMSPYLDDDDIVLVDCKPVSQIKDGKVYAIRYGDDLKIKRLKRSIDGDFVVMSDNPNYETEMISKSSERFAVIGEVKWRAG